ncbi:unnamed protein product [Brassica rapa subsp. narinosa]
MERSKRRRFGSQSSRWRRIGQGCCIAWRTRSITCVLSFFFRRHVEGHQSQTDLYDLWIWHAFFGAPGTMNDLNILDRSPVFDDIINGIAPQVNFYVNGNPYHYAYYLTDGIYPKWATFIQSIRLPQT